MVKKEKVQCKKGYLVCNWRSCEDYSCRRRDIAVLTEMILSSVREKYR